MGKGKPRHNPDKPQNKFDHCYLDDDTKWKECSRPWADKCDGNMYNCYKLALHHLASLSESEREKLIDEYESRGFKFGVARTNYL